MNGASIVCHVVNFKPYFFVKAPDGFTHDYCRQFETTFNSKVLDQIRAESFKVFLWDSLFFFGKMATIIENVGTFFQTNGHNYTKRIIFLIKKMLQGLTKAVLGVELCKKENIYGFSSKGKEQFLKITVALWTLMPSCKKVCETGFDVQTSSGRSGFHTDL